MLRALLVGTAVALALPAGAVASRAAPWLGPGVAPRSSAVALSPGSSVPSPGNYAELYTDVCVSSSDCWAVGRYENSAGATLNQALRWNGRKWHEVRVPQPGGSAMGAVNYLEWVACTAATHCWAVGYYAIGGVQLNEALRWDGKKWTLVSTPQPGGAASGDESNLYGVTCLSDTDCWAVGIYTMPNGAVLNQALRWNGKKWSLVSTPQPQGTSSEDQNMLDSVTCTSASNCWAPGNLSIHDTVTVTFANQMLHWNGKEWSVAHVPQPGGASSERYIEQVVCPTQSSCWGVGEYEEASTMTSLNQVLRRNGKRWRLVPSPQPGGTASGDQSYLDGIDCVSTKDCWAVGSYNNAADAELNQALRWNGRQWRQVKTPQPAGTDEATVQNVTYSVACTSSRRCWTAGYLQNSNDMDMNEILRWNGKSWAQN